MNQVLRQELAAQLSQVCQLIPEMRTGQIMASVGEICQDLHGRGLWDATDEELSEAFWQFQQNYEQAIMRSHQLL
jgi:hypothetical protein